MKSLNLLAVAQAALAISLVVLAMAVVVPPPRSARTIAARSAPRSSVPDRDIVPTEERWRDESAPPSERAAAAIARYDGNRTATPDRTASNESPSLRRSTKPRPVSRERATPRPPVERVAERERTFDAPPRREPLTEKDEDRTLPPAPVEPLAPVETAEADTAADPHAPRVELGPVDDTINGIRYRHRTTKSFAAALSGTNDEKWVNMRIVVEQPEPRSVAGEATAPSGDSTAATRLDARLDVLKSQLEAVAREQEMRQQLQMERTTRIIERQQHSTQLLDIERRLLELRTEMSTQKSQQTPAAPPTPQPTGAVESSHEIYEEMQPPIIQRTSAEVVVTEVTDSRRRLPQISPGPSSQLSDPHAGGPYGGHRIPMARHREILPHPIEAPTPPNVAQSESGGETETSVETESPNAADLPAPSTAMPATMIDAIPENLFDEAPPATAPPEFPASPVVAPSRAATAAPVANPTPVPAPLNNETSTARPIAGPNAVDNKAVASAQYHRARDLLSEGNVAQARQHCDQAIELDPELGDARRLRQEIEVALRKPQRTLFNWPRRSR
jgi:hypothetical protein